MSRRSYAEPLDLDNKEFIEFAITYYVKAAELADMTLQRLTATKMIIDPSIRDAIVTSIVHSPLIFVYERFLYEKAKPTAEKVAGQIGQKATPTQ